MIFIFRKCYRRKIKDAPKVGHPKYNRRFFDSLRFATVAQDDSIRGMLEGPGASLRPDEFDAVAGADPGVAGHAAHGVEAGGIDAEVLDEILAHVEADDLAQHDDAAAGSVAGVDDLEQLALHLGRRLGHARRADGLAGDRRQAGERELVHVRRHLGCGGIGCRGDGVADDVDDELAGFLDVAQGVFASRPVSARRLPSRSAGQKSTVGGTEPTPEKKLKGARLATPSRLIVETSATGRGTMMPVISL